MSTPDDTAAAQHDTVELLVREAVRAVEPLVTAAERGPAGLRQFAAEAGLDLDAVFEDLTDLEAVATELATAFDGIDIDALLDGDSLTPADLEALYGAVTSVVDAVDAVRGIDTAAAAGVDADAVAARLSEYLLIEHLRLRHPDAYSLLAMLGVVVVDPPSADATTTAPYRSLAFDAVSNLTSSPTAVLEAVFAWGTDEFSAYDALEYLRTFLVERGIDAAVEIPPADVATAVGADPGGDALPPALRIPLYAVDTGSDLATVGLFVLPVPGTSGEPPGFAVMPFGAAAAGVSTPLDEDGTWRFEADTTADAGTPYAVVVRPTAVELLDLSSGSTAPALRASLGVRRSTPADPRPVLLGVPDGPRLEAAFGGVSLSMDYEGGEASFAVDVAVDARLAIEAPAGDGFLRTVLPADGLSADLPTSVGLTDDGVRIDAGTELRTTLPLHLALGPVGVESVHLGLSVDASGGITTDVATTITTSLGPLDAAVEQLGVDASFAVDPAGGGALGPLEFDVGIRPPSGIGISIDAAAVSGGGYLFFDAENERYAGAIELDLGGIAVSAVGLLTTRMPDGSDGFSLLVIVAGEFTPIQLGLGFTLNAVGGLLGFHRATEVSALQAGVRDGTLGSILFPEDPVANAPQLISDLRRVFPPAADRHVFGPMFKLGWGTPSVITADLGVLLAFPNPKLIVLGRLRAALPDADAAVLLLNMDAVGVVDFDAATAAVDASLYDSRIAAYSLTGDMAMRSSWGADPGFGLSVGGFHPKFSPPPDFPALRRVAVSLAAGNNPRIRMAGYFALTSNTVQAGAKLDFYAGAGGFSASGTLGFDSLFQFDPFRLLLDMYGRVTLRGGPFTVGVGLDLSLSGPGPWHASGTASFEFLFLTAKVRFDATIGETVEQPALPAAAVLPPLTAALSAPGNWDAQLPTAAGEYVTLREIDPADGEVLVHPLGSLTVRQQVVPLGVTIDTYGQATPSEGNHFTVRPAGTPPGSGNGAGEDVRERFAPAQYLDLTDAERLARPSFEAFPAGRRVANAGLGYGEPGESLPADVDDDGTVDAGEVTWGSDPLPQSTVTSLEYETEVVGRDQDPSAATAIANVGSHRVLTTTATALAAVGAVATAPTRTTGAERYAVVEPPLAVSVSDVGYTVATTDDLEVRDEVGDPTPPATADGGVSVTTEGDGDTSILASDEAGRARRSTYTEARQRLDRHVAGTPADAGRLQVLGRHEVPDSEGADTGVDE